MLLDKPNDDVARVWHTECVVADGLSRKDLMDQTMDKPLLRVMAPRSNFAARLAPADSPPGWLAKDP